MPYRLMAHCIIQPYLAEGCTAHSSGKGTYPHTIPVGSIQFICEALYSQSVLILNKFLNSCEAKGISQGLELIFWQLFLAAYLPFSL